MPGTVVAGCPPVLECCDGHVPPSRLYATLTVQPGSLGCDCMTTVVVALDLAETGDFTTNPNCPGCKTGETWYKWQGSTTEPHCCAGRDPARFCVQVVCDVAGLGPGCGGFAGYFQVFENGYNGGVCPFDTADMINLPAPDSCECEPSVGLHWTSPFDTGLFGGCDSDHGGGDCENVAGSFTMEVTE